MIIEYEQKSGKFLITCAPSEYAVVSGMPDRRFRKTTKTWAAPALKRNVEYMATHMSNPQMYSKEALTAFNEKRAQTAVVASGQSAQEVFPPWYKFKNSPMTHQLSGLKKWYPLDYAAIMYEQGLGKTYTSINLSTAWRMTNKIDAVVVICPSSIKLVWNEELQKHCPIEYQSHTLTNTKSKSLENFISNKDDFQWLVVGVEGLSQGNAYDKILSFMVGRRVAIIIDESSRIKTNGKIRTGRCIKLGAMASKRVILSGTALTQGIEDLFPQFKFLDPNILGFNSFYSFRAHFCVMIKMEVKKDQYVPKIVGYKNENELIESVAHCTQRVEKADVLDIEPKVFMNRHVTMNPTQKKAYADMVEELIVSIDGVEYEVTTVLEKMLRLQQITGGFYPSDDGEKTVPKPIPGKNPKLEELIRALDDISGKVIVWCLFRHEIAMIAERLEKEGIGFVEFHGGRSGDEKEEAVKAFKNDPRKKVFLASRAAAYGLTLTESKDAIYYSQGYSLEEYSQSQDRIHRIGQKGTCTYCHLLCDKTVDVDVIEALNGKKNLADMVYNLIKANN